MSKFCKSLLATLFVSNALHGGIVVFSDRSSWESAVGGAIVTEDFNSYTTDVLIGQIPGSHDFGSFVVSSVDPAASPWVRVDAPGLSEHSIDSTSYLRIFHNAARLTTMTFDSPITAWGSDYDHAQFNGTGIQINTVGLDFITSPDLALLGPDSPSFIGFVSTESFTELQFLGGGDGLGYDNVSFSGEVAVPEPSTYALIGIGFLALFGLLKRRLIKRES